MQGLAAPLRLLTAALAAVAGISLVTGALGLLNIALASVTQRTREFGLRRAFGATRSDIFAMVLLESLAVTATAGVVGAAIGVATSLVIPALLGLPLGTSATPVPLGATVVGIAVSILVGLFAGFVPARKATAVEVIDALRT